MTVNTGLWLIITIVLMVGLHFYHQKKPEKGQQQENFSNVTLFFDPINGEGDIFVGGILVLIFFSLFLMEFSSAVRAIFI